MGLSLDQALYVLYPDDVRTGKIKCKEENDGRGVVISRWDLPTKQLSDDEIISAAAKLGEQYKTMLHMQKCVGKLADIIEKTARSKRYNGSSSCISYINSSNAIWRGEAKCFLAWRDEVMEYAIKIQNDAEGMFIAKPDMDVFLNDIPKISWPS